MTIQKWNRVIYAKIPEERNDVHHGYHRPCYQVYTNLRDCRKRPASEKDQPGSPKKRRTIQQSGTLLPQDSCIICCRKNKYLKRKQECLIQCVTDTAKQWITEAARLKSDNRLISITETHCLIAQQARYHESCLAGRCMSGKKIDMRYLPPLQRKSRFKKPMPKVSHISCAH